MTEKFFSELKRRNVLRVLVAYLALSWLVMQIADTLTEAMSLPEWTMRLLVVIGALGLPFVIFFSWAFEITPEGIKREEEVDRTQSITNITAKKLNIVIIMLLIVTLGHSIYLSNQTTLETPPESKLVEDQSPAKAIVPGSESEATSIAVLPFANLSSDPEQEYFSDGITEELLNLLAKTPNLKVAARTSSFQFKNKNINIQDIAKQLGVTTVLEGSIRKSGNKIRITAQLIKADDGFHLWSNTYDEELNDIFDVQDRISEAIVGSLKESLGIELQVAKVEQKLIDPLAHDFYLKGLQGININSFDSLKMAQDYFQRAINIEPNYTQFKLALAKAIMYRQQIGDRDEYDLEQQAISILDNILDEQPNNPDALYLMALVTRWMPNKVEYSMAQFEKAYALAPDHPLIIEYVAFFSFDRIRRLSLNQSQLTSIFNRLVAKDPLNADLYYGWGIINTNYFMDYETTAKMYRRAIELNPADSNYEFFLAGYYVHTQADLISAIPLLQNATKSDPTDPDGPIYLAKLYQSLGDLKSAQKWIDNALTREPNSGQAKLVYSAILYSLGHQKRAFEALELALDDDKVFHRRNSRTRMVSLGVFLLLKDKQVAKARRFLFSHFPDLESVKEAPPPKSIKEIGYPVSIWVAIELAAGNDELSKRLGSRLTLLTEERAKGVKPKLDYRDYLGLAATGVGNKTDEQVIEYLEKAIDSGYLGDWRYRLLMRPEFLHLYDHPRFKRLIDEIEVKVARQQQFL